MALSVKPDLDHGQEESIAHKIPESESIPDGGAFGEPPMSKTGATVGGLP